MKKINVDFNDIFFTDGCFEPPTINSHWLCIKVKNIDVVVNLEPIINIKNGLLLFKNVISSVRHLYEYIGDPKKGDFKEPYFVDDGQFDSDSHEINTFKLEGFLLEPPSWIDNWTIKCRNFELFDVEDCESKDLESTKLTNSMNNVANMYQTFDMSLQRKLSTEKLISLFKFFFKLTESEITIRSKIPIGTLDKECKMLVIKSDVIGCVDSNQHLQFYYREYKPKVDQLDLAKFLSKQSEGDILIRDEKNTPYLRLKVTKENIVEVKLSREKLDLMNQIT
ncbi:hypothetical protein [Marinicella sp. W31]|uniref:hypothetical protein n=1 Tax=Marinicella sp. W31 TaxID=3023713 RepID=UPI003758217E